MTKKEYQISLKRLLRQLSERNDKILTAPGTRKLSREQSYQNKRREFIEFIDEASKTDWFTFPKKGTRMWRLYHDIWS